MSAVGLIAREARNNLNSSLTNASTLPIEVLPEILDAKGVIESEDFETVETLKEAWLLTREEREKLLKTLISTSDYMHKYPYLKTPAGYELVRIVKRV